jgi:trehalose-6-phosphate synthase
LRSTVVIGEAMDQALRMSLVERRKRWFKMMGELRRS